MQKSSSKKTLLITIGLIILALLTYFYLTGTPQDDAALVSTEAPKTTDATATGARILTLLNQIKSLRIDSNFFTSNEYTSLVDHTVPIYEQPVGKSNPFYNPTPPKKSK